MRDVSTEFNLSLSHHAEVRCRQRGVRCQDIDIIFRYGSRVDDECFIITRQDATEEINRLKREIAALERLKGCKLVVSDETAVTVYRPSKRNIKKSLRDFGRGAH